MRVVKTLFYFMKPADYTYYTYFLIFRRLKRVGSVLSRSELEPFPYIWYQTARTQSGLSPCGNNDEFYNLFLYQMCHPHELGNLIDSKLTFLRIYNDKHGQQQNEMISHLDLVCRMISYLIKVLSWYIYLYEGLTNFPK